MSDRLWLWKNFADGKPEYWAFDNPFPIYLDSDDPQVLGEPCGYAVYKPSRRGRLDVSDEQALARINSDDADEIERLRARVAELEKTLAEANEEADVREDGDTLVGQIKMYVQHRHELASQNITLRKRVAELEAELHEQSRIHGMGSEREARLLARVAELERAQDDEVLASVSPSSSRREWCSGSAWLWPGDRIVVIRSPRLSPPKEGT